jgi:4-hydroxybenzoate polyprenyltransferase
MDAVTQAKAIPLAVDLDGTLIAGDVLWEQMFALIKAQPFCMFLIPFWLMTGGKLRLKREVAQRASFDPSTLAYRQDVLAWLREQHAAGRAITLATASRREQADAVARHLGLFSRVIASDDTVNLKSAAKRDALVALHGDGGFDYAGNSADDVAVFAAARQAVVVAPDRAAAEWHRTHGGLKFSAEPVGFKTVLKMLRVHQWLKNGLIFVPLVLAHQFGDPALLLNAVLAFMAFSATASAIYILNDLFDLKDDRRHATKNRRPFASGRIGIPAGLSVMAGLLAFAGLICLFLPAKFAAVMLVYLLATTAYSLSVKRMLLIDILMLAGLYTIRLVAGSAATGMEASFWLLAFSGFFFLSLALVKRHVELARSTVSVGERLSGRGYRPEDLTVISQGGVASAFAAALVLALYVDSAAVRELYDYPWMICSLAPLVLYINLRVWVLALRGEMNEDPVVFIMQDWRSQIMIALGAAMVVVAAAL